MYFFELFIKKFAEKKIKELLPKIKETIETENFRFGLVLEILRYINKKEKLNLNEKNMIKIANLITRRYNNIKNWLNDKEFWEMILRYIKIYVR